MGIRVHFYFPAVPYRLLPATYKGQPRIVLVMVLRGLAGYYISGVDALTQTISQVNFEADLYHAYLHFIPTSYNRDSSNVIHMHTCTRVWVRLCLISFVFGDLTCLSIVA